MYLRLKSKDAFTLLEALMGMFVMSVLMMLILQMVIVLNDNMNSYYNKRQDVLFVMQSNRDVLKSKEIYVKDNILYFKTYDNTEISYLLKEDEIIRQVDGKGYEVILSNVESATFYESDKKCYVEVKHFNEKAKTFYIGTNYF